MKNLKFATGEFYHVYNRGVDKRFIFSDSYDVQRFLESMEEFNTKNPIGSLYETSFLKPETRALRKQKRLVEIVAYCFNPNHFHFLVRQVSQNGISEFFRRLLGGYTWYFNNKHTRSGVLFQGTFKAKHIDSNEYLLHISAYVNLNDQVHQLGGGTAKLVASSWNEYMKKSPANFCSKDIILKQFKNKNEYQKFAHDSLKDIIERKKRFAEMQILLLEEI